MGGHIDAGALTGRDGHADPAAVGTAGRSRDSGTAPRAAHPQARNVHRQQFNANNQNVSHSANVNVNRNVHVNGGYYGPNWGGVAAGVAVGAGIGAAATAAATASRYPPPPPYPYAYGYPPY